MHSNHPFAHPNHHHPTAHPHNNFPSPQQPNHYHPSANPPLPQINQPPPAVIGPNQASPPQSQIGQSATPEGIFGRQPILALPPQPAGQPPNVGGNPNPQLPQGPVGLMQFLAHQVKYARLLDMVMLASLVLSILIVAEGIGTVILDRMMLKDREDYLVLDVINHKASTKDELTAEQKLSSIFCLQRLADIQHLENSLIKRPIWVSIICLGGGLGLTALSSLGLAMLKYPEVKWPGSPLVAVRWSRVEFLTICILTGFGNLMVATVEIIWAAKFHTIFYIIVGPVRSQYLDRCDVAGWGEDARLQEIGLKFEDFDILWFWPMNLVMGLNFAGTIFSIINGLVIFAVVVLWCCFLFNPPLPPVKAAQPQAPVSMMMMGQQQQQQG